MRRIGAILLALAALTPALAWAEAKPIDKIEARALPTEETKRRVLDQLADILIEGPRPKTRRPVAPLSELWFSTKVRATGYRGLCAYDSVIVGFAPVAKAPRGAKLPVKANSLQASTNYRLLAPARTILHGDEVKVGSAACLGLKPGQGGFFKAAHEDEALEAAGRLELAVIAASGKEDLPFDLVCDRKGDVPAEECRIRLSALSTNNLESVESCGNEYTPMTNCTRMYLSAGRDYYSLDIWGSSTTIYRARLSTLLIMADERRD